MGTKISTQKSKEVISRLIRDKFDDNITSNEECQELIATAMTYGLNELADEMQDDLQIHNDMIQAQVDQVLAPINEIMETFRR